AARDTGAALVVVTHDPQVAAWCSRTVQMRDGQVVADTAQPSTEAAVPPAAQSAAGAVTPTANAPTAAAPTAAPSATPPATAAAPAPPPQAAPSSTPTMQPAPYTQGVQR